MKVFCRLQSAKREWICCLQNQQQVQGSMLRVRRSGCPHPPAGERHTQSAGASRTSPACRGGGPASRPVEGCRPVPGCKTSPACRGGGPAKPVEGCCPVPVDAGFVTEHHLIRQRCALPPSPQGEGLDLPGGKLPSCRTPGRERTGKWTTFQCFQMAI